ncbi:MAG: hypothetical protein ABSF28_23260 [Terracidiphilus sp.]
MIPELRTRFNAGFTQQSYAKLLAVQERLCGTKVDFRIAETPIFVPLELLNELAEAGLELAGRLLGNPTYLAAARLAIPTGFRVANETPRPHFLTADFAFVKDPSGKLVPRLVEIQAFPSVYGYQAALCSGYREVFGLQDGLGWFLGGLNETSYWELLGRTILGMHQPENVVLTELDPLNQKTLPDFQATARRVGIAVVDIRSLVPIDNRLHYRNAKDRLVPIHRIYNRAIADELMARHVQLPFDFTHPWDVEWAGHPNWYFLISKFSIPWLAGSVAGGASAGHAVIPPAVFLSDFLLGDGRQRLASAGVSLPARTSSETTYSELLLKPLFSFAGKGIQFDPTEAQLQAIPADQRQDFLLQQRMHFVPNIETPRGLTQAEIRILYLWPDGGDLTPAISLVRLGRGKMMGVDHNRNQEWVGASAAFFPTAESPG